MCGSCIDESTTSSDSISNALTSALTQPPVTTTTKSPERSRCCIVGSGTSVILDAEVGVEAESRKLPSSKYKGVVPQPNGRWGAQIYEKHQRVWLGTFNEESEAARAYDVAVQRFRGRDAVTNLKVIIEDEDEVELMFLNSHSKSEIVDMLRKHTYDDELEQSRKKMNMDGNERKLLSYKKGNFSSLGDKSSVMKVRVNLFEKAVTPSDVGKLNRLVIPKQHAEKHFPLGGSGNNTTTTKGVLLNFEDVSGKVWRFRYSYWNSSQSYVLTKGWSRFVKEKNLKAGDIIMFQKSSTGQADDHKQLYIDWKQRNGNGNSVSVPSCSTIIQIPPQQQPVKMFRLFGVNIVNVPGSNVNVVCSSNNICSSSGKRGRDIQLLESECIKKPKAINAL